MRLKTAVGIGTVTLVAMGLGAMYWLHARDGRPVSDVVVSAEPREFHELPAVEKPGTTETAKSAKSLSAAESRKAAPPVDPGLPLKAGEELQYTANVSKLSNVATLTLKVVGRGSFTGKNAWHLQALAHTECLSWTINSTPTAMLERW